MHRTRFLSLASLALAGASALYTLLANEACASSAPACRVGADCASGACSASGDCVASGTGNSPDGSAAFGDAAFVEASTPEGDSGFCTPNADGTITKAEVPAMAGLRATYLIAANATFDTTGSANGDGTRSWDMTVALTGDHAVLVSTEDTAGAWYAAQFNGATYASKLSDSQDLLGVFDVTDTAIALLGVVSPTSAMPSTELSYSPSATTLAFPLIMGASWSSTSTITGTASSVPTAATEKYESTVDATGTMKTPYGSFAVQRVRTLLTRTVGVVPTTLRTYTFVAECFGSVAQIVSQTNEPNAEFTSVSEARRLAP